MIEPENPNFEDQETNSDHGQQVPEDNRNEDRPVCSSNEVQEEQSATSIGVNKTQKCENNNNNNISGSSVCQTLENDENNKAMMENYYYAGSTLLKGEDANSGSSSSSSLSSPVTNGEYNISNDSAGYKNNITNENSSEALLRQEREKVIPEFECPICMKLLLRPVTTLCGHTYCRFCLHETLMRKPVCPLCRRDVDERTTGNPNVVLETIIRNTFPLLLAKRIEELKSSLIHEDAIVRQKRNEDLLKFIKHSSANKNMTSEYFEIPLIEETEKAEVKFPGQSYDAYFEAPPYVSAVVCLLHGTYPALGFVPAGVITEELVEANEARLRGDVQVVKGGGEVNSIVPPTCPPAGEVSSSVAARETQSGIINENSAVASSTGDPKEVESSSCGYLLEQFISSANNLLSESVNAASKQLQLTNYFLFPRRGNEFENNNNVMDMTLERSKSSAVHELQGSLMRFERCLTMSCTVTLQRDNHDTGEGHVIDSQLTNEFDVPLPNVQVQREPLPTVAALHQLRNRQQRRRQPDTDSSILGNVWSAVSLFATSLYTSRTTLPRNPTPSTSVTSLGGDRPEVLATPPMSSASATEGFTSSLLTHNPPVGRNFMGTANLLSSVENPFIDGPLGRVVNELVDLGSSHQVWIRVSELQRRAAAINSGTVDRSTNVGNRDMQLRHEQQHLWNEWSSYVRSFALTSESVRASIQGDSLSRRLLRQRQHILDNRRDIWTRCNPAVGTVLMTHTDTGTTTIVNDSNSQNLLMRTQPPSTSADPSSSEQPEGGSATLSDNNLAEVIDQEVVEQPPNERIHSNSLVCDGRCALELSCACRIVVDLLSIRKSSHGFWIGKARLLFDDPLDLRVMPSFDEAFSFCDSTIQGDSSIGGGSQAVFPELNSEQPAEGLVDKPLDKYADVWRTAKDVEMKLKQQIIRAGESGRHQFEHRHGAFMQIGLQPKSVDLELYSCWVCSVLALPAKVKRQLLRYTRTGERMQALQKFLSQAGAANILSLSLGAFESSEGWTFLLFRSPRQSLLMVFIFAIILIVGAMWTTPDSMSVFQQRMVWSNAVFQARLSSALNQAISPEQQNVINRLFRENTARFTLY